MPAGEHPPLFPTTARWRQLYFHCDHDFRQHGLDVRRTLLRQRSGRRHRCGRAVSRNAGRRHRPLRRRSSRGKKYGCKVKYATRKAFRAMRLERNEGIVCAGPKTRAGSSAGAAYPTVSSATASRRADPPTSRGVPPARVPPHHIYGAAGRTSAILILLPMECADGLQGSCIADIGIAG